MTSPPPKKRTKIDVLEDQIVSTARELREELDRTKEALRQAARVIADPHRYDKWKDMPEALRHDPDAYAEYLAHDRLCVLYKHHRKECPEDVLLQALPLVLERYRSIAVKGVETKFFSWEEVNPTVDEWTQSETLFAEAVKRGLVADLSQNPFPESVPVTMEAMQQGMITHMSQAPCLTHDMVLDALKDGRVGLEKVPDDLKNDLKFCRAVLVPFPSFGLSCFRDEVSWDSLAKQVFDLHPDTLLQDGQVWEKIIGFDFQFQHIVLRELFESNYQPTDPHMIRYACTKYPTLFGKINQVTHGDFVRDWVVADRTNLFRLTQEFLEAFPDFFVEQLALVAPALENVDVNDPRTLLDTIPLTMWTTYPTLMDTWIEVGLPLVGTGYGRQEEPPIEWNVDSHKLLRIAEHGAKKHWRIHSFCFMSDELRNDVDFITRVMHFEPGVLGYASESLQENEKLSMWALSDSYFVENRIIPSYFCWSGDPPDDYELPQEFVEVVNHWKAKLQTQKAFKNIFLVAVSSNCNSLGLLRDPIYLKAIRDYADIPSGDYLRHMRLALANIERALESHGISVPVGGGV